MMPTDSRTPAAVTWVAAMISPERDVPAPLLRRELTLDADHGPAVRARLHLSSLGIFEAWLNGTRLGEDVLSPGWTSYEWRLRYRTYDVTDLLQETSVIGVSLGNGWARGRLGWNGNRAFYTDRLGLIAQLEVDFADGHRQVVGTDDRWAAGPSDTLSDDLYDGQTIDARRRDESWHRPGPPPPGWVGVDVLEFDTGRLTPYVGPPVTRQESRRPQAIWTSPSGKTLVDFGQNLVGWLRFTVRGAPGSEITVRHAEVLEDDELGVRPLRSAEATDRFVLSGGTDTFEPTKTFHGFRYAEVSGWPGELTPDDLEAVVVHSRLRRTGHFSCSDELLNRLHSNAVWGLRGNFLDVPTDCPQRDERMGWTGDIAVFAPSAAFLYDVEDFLADWLLDVAAEQRAQDGLVPFVVPDCLKYEEMPKEFPAPESSAIWSDAAVWVPWALWQAYGDRAVLDTQYDSMVAHLRRVASLLSPHGVWDRGFQFGDWLDPQAPPDEPFQSLADDGAVATACAYRTARIMAEVAALTGHFDDAAEFGALADRVRAGFVETYHQDDGTITSHAPSLYALAIVFGVLEGEDRQVAGNHLAALVAENGHRIATGFAGTPYVTDALTATGHLDVAYRLLQERSCPSWLYAVTMGATTIWERWDSMLPDGRINPGEMTSFNHYALGAVVDWMHRTIGGLAPLEPGYRRVRVAPRPGGDLTWADTSLETRHGRVAVRWRLEDSGLRVDVSLPAGVTGVLSLPGEDDVELSSGTTTHSSPSGVSSRPS
jgi:alpha-L-rhamnosidase